MCKKPAQHNEKSIGQKFWLFLSGGKDDNFDDFLNDESPLGELAALTLMEPQVAPEAKGAEESATAVEDAARVISELSGDLHHAYPKYLGGPVKQQLVALSRDIHQLYHVGLDAIAPRRAGATFYAALKPEARAALFGRVAAYTKAFDAQYGTHIYDAMIREGFPAPP
jgi:hypothetical protein